MSAWLPDTRGISPPVAWLLGNSGYEVCRLVEELVPFMDHSIDDPAAAQLSALHHKRKLTEPDIGRMIAKVFWVIGLCTWKLANI